jgi:hypothetical protein
MGAGRTEPSGLIVVLWLGAASLAAGVISLGIALLRSQPAVLSHDRDATP